MSAMPRPRWPQKPKCDKPCSIDGCERPVQARGWCNIHYHRHRKYGSTADPHPNYSTCSVDGCDRPTRNRRNPHCVMHYERLRRSGTTERAEPKPKVPRQRPVCSEAECSLPAGKTGFCRVHARRNRARVEVDPEIRFARAVRPGPVPEYAPELGPCLIYTGADNGNGYGQFRYNGRPGYAHRYAWERERGAIPEGLTIDHLCRVRHCVNIAHLELVDGPTNTRRAAAVRTACPNGHEYNRDNTRYVAGRRRCIRCETATRQRSGFKRTAAYTGKPHGNVRYDQALVRSVIADIRRAETTIAQGARQIGCNPNYLGRRVWQETKRDVFARDGACVLCGSTEQLDAHHRHARGTGGSANPATSFGMANLVTLCRRHHNEVEQHPDWARTKGLRLDTGEVPSAVPVATICGRVLLDDEGGLREVEPAA